MDAALPGMLQRQHWSSEAIDGARCHNAADLCGHHSTYHCLSSWKNGNYRVLVEKGANVNAEHDAFGYNPIIAAAHRRRDDVVRFLLRQGADPFVYTKVKGDVNRR